LRLSVVHVIEVGKAQSVVARPHPVVFWCWALVSHLLL